MKRPSSVLKDDDKTLGSPDGATREEALTRSLNESVEELIALRRAHRQSEERAERLRVELEESAKALRLLEERSAEIVAKKEKELADRLTQQRLAFEYGVIEQWEIVKSLQATVEASGNAIVEVARGSEVFKNGVESLGAALRDHLQAAEVKDADYAKAIDQLREGFASQLEGVLVQGRSREASLEKSIEELRAKLADTEAARRDAIAEGQAILAKNEQLAAELERVLAASRQASAATGREAEEARRALAEARVAAARHSAESQSLQHSLAHLRILIGAIIDEPRNRWQRLIGGRPSPALKASLEWASRPAFAPSFFSDHAVEGPMVSGQRLNVPQSLPIERNPYLRANSVTELLAFHDIDFVRCAYVTILGRQPDPEGEDYYTHSLRNGASKYYIIWALRNSDEAAKHDPGITGLDKTLRRYRRARFPLIGRVFEASFAKEHDAGERQMRRLENAMLRAHLDSVERLRSLELLIREFWTAFDASQRELPAPIAPSDQASASFGDIAAVHLNDEAVLRSYGTAAVESIRKKLSGR